MSERLPRRFGGHLLVDLLGQGASGEVFLARPGPDLKVSAPFVVVKRLRREQAENDQSLARFSHEAQLAVQVASPHIAAVFEAGASEDTFYLVLEHVPGWTLTELLIDAATSKRTIPLEICAGVVAGVLAGLTDLHEASDGRGTPLGAVHRDLAPKNLMLREDGTMKIIDLGIGKSNLREWATKTGVVLGSPGYMAPEQVRAETIDERTDLYAMGTVAYELMTLRPFVPRGPTLEMLASVLDERELEAAKYRSDLSPAALKWLKRALAFEPKDRFQSAREMRAGLSEWTGIASPAEILAYFQAWAGGKLEARRERMRVWTDAPATIAEGIEATEVFVRRSTQVAPMPLLTPPPQFAPLPQVVVTVPQPRSRTSVVLPLFAVLLTTAAVTVWVMSSSSPEPAPIPAVLEAVVPEPVRVAPRVEAVPEEVEVPQETAPREVVRKKQLAAVPADTIRKDSIPRTEVQPASAVPDVRERLSALEKKLGEVRRGLPESAASRQKLLELELDLSGARSIEDGERLARVLDRVERELRGIAP